MGRQRPDAERRQSPGRRALGARRWARSEPRARAGELELLLALDEPVALQTRAILRARGWRPGPRLVLRLAKSAGGSSRSAWAAN